jgi:hypothetical protein
MNMLVILHAREVEARMVSTRHLLLTRELEEARTLACEDGGGCGCRELCQNIVKMHFWLALACEGSGRRGNAIKIHLQLAFECEGGGGVRNSVKKVLEGKC